MSIVIAALFIILIAAVLGFWGYIIWSVHKMDKEYEERSKE